MKVLLSANFLLEELGNYKHFFEKNNIELITPRVDEKLTEKELVKYAPYIDGTICGDDEWTSDVMEKATNLKIISKWGTGIDSIDLEYAKKKGIKVTNTPNAFSEPVSDSTLSYILAFARNPRKTTDLIKSGKWGKIKGFSLNEKVVGVIGLGNIGKATIRKLAGFGCKILGYDQYPEIVSDHFKYFTGLEIVSFEELLKNSDIIALCCNLNRSTYKMLSENEFCKMKKGVHIINTARGPLIDEGALIKARKEGIVDGIALDVFEVEPLPLNSELRNMENIILAPHNANSSWSAWQYVHYNSINNLFEFLGYEKVTIPNHIKHPEDSEKMVKEVIKRCM